MRNVVAEGRWIPWVFIAIVLAALLAASFPAFAADTTPPTAPPQPTEGSTIDRDAIGGGSYYVYWYGTPAAADAESGIAAYELQERAGLAGAWSTLSTTAYRYAYVSGRLDTTTYFYQVRAQNKAGLWGPFSPSSDGILIDKTVPVTIATVTDDGAAQVSLTSLHATWTPTTDAQSGVVGYQYLIRQDSTSGAVIVTYTSVGLATEVTRAALNLLPGKLYFVGVLAKNGAGLYSTPRYSDGIRTPDPTPPGSPGQPMEGSSTATVDYDYDGDGSYYVSWAAASDPDSGIAAYELQERAGPVGAWITLTTTATSRYAVVSGRLNTIQYRYQVRAKNGAGAWGGWSASSDGIVVDNTPPSAVTVADDGSTTASSTWLHAVWTISSDPESGIAGYQYCIRQDSTSGAVIVSWTSTGTATEVTRASLSLINGKKYFIGVAAKNGGGLLSSTRYSDGITVVFDTTPPVITSTMPADGSVIGAAQTAPAIAATAQTAASPGSLSVVLIPGLSMGGMMSNSLYVVRAGFPPSLPPPQAGSRMIAVEGSADEVISSAIVNGVAAVVTGSAFRAEGVPVVEGPNQIAITAKDLAGNPATKVITVTLDTRPPARPTVATAPTILATATHTLTGTKTPQTSVWISDQEVVSLNDATTWSATVSFIEGDNVFVIVTKDAAGNASASNTARIVVDALPPVVSFAAPSKTNLTPATLTGSVDDSLTAVTINGIVAARQGQGFSVDIPLSPGANTLRLAAVSPNGHVTEAAHAITLGTIPTLQIIQPAARAKVPANAPATLQVTASDAEQDPIEYRFSVDGAPLGDWSSAASIVWTPSLSATSVHTITAAVRDAFGGERTVDVKVRVARPTVEHP
ncbi:MAG: fibronectin type III domain-containing protein [Candidatus Omnitrophica bacterium]|nr:fibronectin type III domain-containing protein [Candidatus Omnitrophota bacterium]